MKSSKHWLWLAMPILAACGVGQDEKVGTEEGFMADTLVGAMGTSDVAVIVPPGGINPAGDTAAGAAAGAAGGMQTVSFTPVGAGGGHAGDVMIHPAGQQTQITVRLSGPQSGTHQGHIHTGTCDNMGGVVQPLEPVDVPQGGQGTSNSTVNIPPATVMNGQHIVLYHTAGGSAPVVCANIPQSTT